MGVATGPEGAGREREGEGEWERPRQIQLGRSCVLIYVTDEQQNALSETGRELIKYKILKINKNIIINK